MEGERRVLANDMYPIHIFLRRDQCLTYGDGEFARTHISLQNDLRTACCHLWLKYVYRCQARRALMVEFARLNDHLLQSKVYSSLLSFTMYFLLFFTPHAKVECCLSVIPKVCFSENEIGFDIPKDCKSENEVNQVRFVSPKIKSRVFRLKNLISFSD